MRYKNIFLLLGSNLGDRHAHLEQCIRFVQNELGAVIKQSSIYETEPWGKSDQPNYLNQAVQIETDLEPEQLLSSCLAIERKMGRERLEKWGSRVIDIDIIYFGDRILNLTWLVIPHPRIAERKFVLTPLAEINPSFLHPVLLKTNEELLVECKDKLSINVFQTRGER